MDDKNGKQEESGVIKAQKPGPREFGRLRKRGSAVREGMIDTLMWILPHSDQPILFWWTLYR